MSTDHSPDACRCCRATGSSTPATVTNTPGRSRIERRVGTSSQFAATMASRLTRQTELDSFTNRRTDDPAIALVDAWSAVLDVLTFYTERLANESYLSTAQDPRSLNELAHSVGYLPGRGRASATALAFTLEDAPGSPPLVPLPAGTKVASLPGPGEVPQSYETGRELVARPQWNAMAARTRDLPGLRAGDTHAYVEGIRSDLTVGDAVLIVGRERAAAGASQYWAFRQLASVLPVPGLGATRIDWVDPLGTPAPSSGRVGDEKVPDARDLRVYVLRRRAAIFGAAAPDHRLITVSGGGKPDPVAGAVVIPDTAKEHAKDSRTEVEQTGPDWPGFSVRVPDQPENTVDLDTTYPATVPGTWAVFTRTGVTVCYRVLAAVEEARTQFTLNAKVTRLSLQGPTVSHLFSTYVRQTTAWVASEPLTLAAPPVQLPVRGILVDLAGGVPTLEAGHTVVVRGPRPVVRVAEGVRTLQLKRESHPVVALHPGDLLEVVGPVTVNLASTTWVTTTGSVTAPPGTLEMVSPEPDAPVHSEVAVVAGPTPDVPEVDRIRFAAALTGCYDPTTVRILGNVAPATHGETRTQVLGSGDAAVPYQRFRLAQAPLTYVLAGSGGAVVSTLEVRVDGRLWREVPRLFGTGPADEVFTTRTDDEDALTVQFGDGLTGARLPTGTNNVSATYRVGTGVAGLVTADQLTLPMTRPLGLRSVTNPLASGLADDPEAPTEVRANASRTALALERIVSLRDVEDFARAVPGIGKASATWLWDGRSRFVHLTVAGTGAQTVDVQALQDLKSAMLAAGDARLPLTVAAAEVVPVHVGVSVVVDPAYDVTAVLDGVRSSIGSALAVDVRTLGQPLTNGDLILASHGVPGVVAVNVTVPQSDVPSSGARMSAAGPKPAQLVVLAPGGLVVTEATA